MVDLDKLISLVYVRKTLWENKHESYHSRNDIRQLWDEIAHEMGYASQTLNMEWKKLRYRFQRENVKLRALNGDGADDKYYSPWRYYRQLLFLADAVRNMEEKATFKDNTTTGDATATSEGGEVSKYIVCRNLELQVKKVMASTEDMMTQANEISSLERGRHRYSGSNKIIRQLLPVEEKMPLQQDHTAFKHNTTDEATVTSEVGEELENGVGRKLELQVKKGMASTEDMMTQANEISSLERGRHRYSGSNKIIRQLLPVEEKMPLQQDHTAFKHNTTDEATVTSEVGEELENGVGRKLELQVKKAMASTEDTMTQANEKSSFERGRHRHSGSNEIIRQRLPMEDKKPLQQVHTAFKHSTTDEATVTSEELENVVGRNLELQVKQEIISTEDMVTQANERSTFERKRYRYSGTGEEFSQLFSVEEKLSLQGYHEQRSSTRGGEDYNFLMSLLPHLLDIPKKRKLAVRQDLLQILIDEESYDSESTYNPN